MDIDAARILVEELLIADAADDLDRASSWTVVCTDQEFGTITLVGVFEDAPSALRYASEWGAELNADCREGRGWKLDVKAIMPASPIPPTR